MLSAKMMLFIVIESSSEWETDRVILYSRVLCTENSPVFIMVSTVHWSVLYYICVSSLVVLYDLVEINFDSKLFPHLIHFQFDSFEYFVWNE